MARSEILSPRYDGIPISDVSGLAFDLPRHRAWSSARFQTGRAATRSERMAGKQPTRREPQEKVGRHSAR